MFYFSNSSDTKYIFEHLEFVTVASKITSINGHKAK
jgi:hypothetical protein